MDNNIVPIGKYKGQPLEVLMADGKYSEWLLAQAWFLDRYADLAQLLRMGRLAEPQDTPEHNAMVAGLIDQRDGMEWLASFDVPAELLDELFSSGMHQELEPKGGDLLVRIQGRPMLVEVKPLIGDDYPSVIRQVKAVLTGPYQPRGIVIARKVEPTNLTLEQVRRQFQLAGVRLVLESEFFAGAAEWADARRAYLRDNIRSVEDQVSEESAGLAVLSAVPHTDTGWGSLRSPVETEIAESTRKIARLNERLALLRGVTP